MESVVERDIRNAVHSAFTFGVSVRDFLHQVSMEWDDQARQLREDAAREFRRAVGKSGDAGG